MVHIFMSVLKNEVMNQPEISLKEISFNTAASSGTVTLEASREGHHSAFVWGHWYCRERIICTMQIY